MQQFFSVRPLCFFAVASLAVLTGCARITAESQINADGSMRRALTYRGTVPDKTGAQPTMTGSNLGDLVMLPTKAGGYTVTREQAPKSNDVAVTGTKTFPVGAKVSNDLGIRLAEKGADAAKPLLENTVSVRETAPGTLEYRETLHWKGDPKEAFGAEPAPEMIAAFRKTLPPELAGDAASLRKATLALQSELWQIIMGPGEPVMPNLVFHPDYAQYQMSVRLVGATDKILSDVYKDRLTPVQRAQIVARLTTEATKTATAKTDSQKQSQTSGADSKGAMPIPILFRVQMPGKITATNGQTGTTPGEVVWPLYSLSPAGGDITLTATCTVTK